MTYRTRDGLDHSRSLDIWIWSNKPEIKHSADYSYNQFCGKRKPLLKELEHSQGWRWQKANGGA
jgi:hypothetical protein